MLDILASACAAEDLGYHGIAQLIRDEQLSPRRIFKLFITYGRARDRGRACAAILLAGSTARHHACPEGWNGDLERDLAMLALRTPVLGLIGRPRPAPPSSTKEFNSLCREAAAIVGKHWREIAAA